jgi:hypothetical protein
MKQNRLTVPKYKEGEECGGVIVGRWLDRPTLPGKVMKDRFEIPQGGLIQLGSRSKKPQKYIPKNWFIAIIVILPKLLKLAKKGYEIIGLWHIQLDSVKPSEDDMDAMEKAMLRLGRTRFVLGTGIIRKGEQRIDFMPVRLSNKTHVRKKR